MFTSLPFRRLLAATTALSMIMPALPAAAQDDAGAAPPTRVGQIAQITGGVSFEGSGSGGWAAAQLNYPVSAGDAIYTQPDGQAAIELDASRIAMAGNTELQMTGLSATDFGATQAQGEVFLSLTDLQAGESFALATPRGTVNISEDGQYDIAAGDANTPTMVTVFAGAATVSAPGATLTIAAGQAAELSGTDVTSAQLVQPQPDDFANAQLQLAEQQTSQAQYQPAVLYQMTGGTELARYGDWAPDPQYGDIWYPDVPPGWAPYRDGYWADVQPWGYTWVDSEPWGFAPFHYGRWFENGGRWGWIPADAAYDDSRDRPVYAPALVTFFGLGLAAGISIGAFSGHSIGWVPLGPGEPFHPYYRVPASYDYRLNRFDVRDARTVDNRQPGSFEQYRNRAAATYIGADQMRAGDRVDRYGHAAGANSFASARPYDPRAADGTAGFRLPEAVPAAREHPGQAPHPTAFAERREVPRATVQHENSVPRENAGMPSPQRPAFGANPGYHAPPPPPDQGHGYANFAQPARPPAEPKVYTPNSDFNRPAEPPGSHLPQVFHPESSGGEYHPQPQPHENLPQVYHPEAAPQPYHPEAQPPFEQRVSPPAQEFHPPQMQQPHFNPPPVEQPHFNPPPAPHPAPPPPPPPHNDKRPGQP